MSVSSMGISSWQLMAKRTCSVSDQLTAHTHTQLPVPEGRAGVDVERCRFDGAITGSDEESKQNRQEKCDNDTAKQARKMHFRWYCCVIDSCHFGFDSLP